MLISEKNQRAATVYTVYRVSRELNSETFRIAKIPQSTAANGVIKVTVSEQNP